MLHINVGTNEEWAANVSSVTIDTIEKCMFIGKMFYKCQTVVQNQNEINFILIWNLPGLTMEMTAKFVFHLKVEQHFGTCEMFSLQLTNRHFFRNTIHYFVGFHCSTESP